MSDSASKPAKPGDSCRCRPQKLLRWLHLMDDSRNAKTTRLAARPCGAWHQCLSRRLPSRLVDSAPSLAIQAMAAPSIVPAIIGIASLDAPQKAEVHGRAKRFQGDPEPVLQRNRPARPPCRLAQRSAAQHWQRRRPHTVEQARPGDAPMTQLRPRSSHLWLLDWAELCLRLRFASLRLARKAGDQREHKRNLFVNASIGSHLGAISQTARRLATAFPQAAFPL